MLVSHMHWSRLPPLLCSVQLEVPCLFSKPVTGGQLLSERERNLTRDACVSEMWTTVVQDMVSLSWWSYLYNMLTWMYTSVEVTNSKMSLDFHLSTYFQSYISVRFGIYKSILQKYSQPLNFSTFCNFTSMDLYEFHWSFMW